jgi:ankyrin repeat protein
MRGRWILVGLAAAAAAAAVLAATPDDTRLVAAIRAHDLAKARGFIAEGVPINTLDAQSASALHWAAHANDLEAVQLLLEAGADPNLANRFGVTPMHEAATVANAEMLTAMLDAGGNANAAFGAGETVLMTAARAGDAESVKALLAHGGVVDATEKWHGQTALMWAAMENHADVVELLLQAGAKVNRASTKHDWVKISYSQGNVPKSRDLGGLTALQFAARLGSVAAADKLLEAGADANAVEPMYQLSSLQLAIVNGHYTLAKKLIDRGVKVNDGSLYLAIDTRNLGYYAQRPNPPDKDGKVTNLDVITALLEHGAKADTPYTKGIPERTVAGEIEVPKGATALDRAAAAGDFAVVELLVAKGANPSVAAEDGTTPLMLLSGYSRQKFGAPPVTGDPQRLAAIRALAAKKVALNAAQKDSGNTALHFAALRKAPDIMALLKELGAEERPNAAGKTPSDLLQGS